MWVPRIMTTDSWYLIRHEMVRMKLSKQIFDWNRQLGIPLSLSDVNIPFALSNQIKRPIDIHTSPGCYSSTKLIARAFSMTEWQSQLDRLLHEISECIYNYISITSSGLAHLVDSGCRIDRNAAHGIIHVLSKGNVKGLRVYELITTEALAIGLFSFKLCIQKTLCPTVQALVSRATRIYTNDKN